MNHDPLYHRLCELGWRRKLTGAEEAELRAYLAAHPDVQADWDAEAVLGDVLNRIPDAPLPSNFTSRVIHAVERDQTGLDPEPRRGWSWRVFLPRLAVAVGVACLGLFASQRYAGIQRARLARNVAAVLSVQPPPSPQLLADFDAIRRLNRTPPPDEELLALLK